MRFLLDTHAFLWLAEDDPRLTPRVRSVFADAGHEFLLSAASVWEMAVKASLGKLVLSTRLETIVRGGIERGVRILEVTATHALAVEHLPFHHRDPFDRLLVAQAGGEGIPILSRDEQLDAYPIKRVWDNG